jgi:hypothetical protein
MEQRTVWINIQVRDTSRISNQDTDSLRSIRRIPYQYPVVHHAEASCQSVSPLCSPHPSLSDLRPSPAANSHRLFVTDDDFSLPSSPFLSNSGSGNLCGIVSIVDSESLFSQFRLDPHYIYVCLPSFPLSLTPINTHS